MSHHDDLPSHYCQRCSQPESACRCATLDMQASKRREVITPTPTADDLARREYASAALAAWGEAHHSLTAQGTGNAAIYIHCMAEVCFDIADAMLAEQKKRETR